MKKFLILSLLLSLGLNFFLLSNEVVEQDDFALEEDRVEGDSISLSQSSIKKPTIDCKPKVIEKIIEKEIFVRNEDETDRDIANLSEHEIKRRFEKSQKDYQEKLKLFFEDELRIQEDELVKYKELKELRDKEWFDYIDPKMPKSLGNGPSKEVYLLTAEDQIMLGKLTQKYQSLLKDTLGMEDFVLYQKFIHEHNQKVMNEGIGTTVEF